MYIYGAGGHAKVVTEILQANGIDPEMYIDDNPAIREFRGKPVVLPGAYLSPLIVAIGDCAVRRSIVESIRQIYPCRYAIAIHPSALVSSSVRIGEGSVVVHAAIIQADTTIGRHTIINTRASVDHDCRIGDFVHIAPGCVLSGGVQIDEGTFVGVSTTIKEGVHVGKNCIIGASSLVLHDVPDYTITYGNPCPKKSKIIRKP